MAEDIASRAGGFLGHDTAAVADNPNGATLDSELSNGERSELIDGLLKRRSVLPSGPYAQVADSVLAANSRAAEASLRAAVLRSQARELNWLPQLGPSISLASMGSFVAGILVEQTLFDGGARRAEREFARADVEVAAVALAQDTNERVFQGLDLYLTSEASVARAVVNEGGIARMERFEHIISERVKAGVNDRADLHLVQQTLSQMRSDILQDREAATTARSELAAFSATPLDGVRGIASLGDVAGAALPLDVLQVDAEGTRSLAEARAQLAGFSPTATVSGVAGQGNNVGLDVGIPNGFGFGRRADMAAIEALAQAAELQTEEQREDSARAVAAIEGELASLRRQQANSVTIVRQAQNNYSLFEQQLGGGQRSVVDVVGVFSTKLRAERDAVDLRYDIARYELRLALIYGTLVDGEDI